MGKIATDASLQELLTLLRDFLNTQQSGLESKIGTLSTLTTTAKGSLVAAINELVANRGNLSGLSTSAKNTIVAAINEVLAKYTTLETASSSHTSSINTLNSKITPLSASTYEAHRYIWRGKNLGSSFTSAQSAAIRAGNFSDFYIGDYWNINGTKYYIVDIDYFYFSPPNHRYNTYNVEGSGSGFHHLVLMDFVVQTTPYHSSNDVSGGYFNSAVRNTRLPEYEAQLATVFGAEHLWKHMDCFCNSVTSSGEAAYVEAISCAEVLSWRHSILNYDAQNIYVTPSAKYGYNPFPFAYFFLGGPNHRSICTSFAIYYRECRSTSSIIQSVLGCPVSFGGVSDLTETKFYFTIY